MTRKAIKISRAKSFQFTIERTGQICQYKVSTQPVKYGHLHQVTIIDYDPTMENKTVMNIGRFFMSAAEIKEAKNDYTEKGYKVTKLINRA